MPVLFRVRKKKAAPTGLCSPKVTRPILEQIASLSLNFNSLHLPSLSAPLIHNNTITVDEDDDDDDNKLLSLYNPAS